MLNKHFIHKAFSIRIGTGVFLLLTVIGIFALFACNGCGVRNDKVLDEGIIEFDTKAVDENHPLAGLAPSSATLKFKKDKFIMEMSTMGMFNTMFIANITSKSLTQMVKFMDVKQACIEGEKDIVIENADYPLKFEETSDTKIIAGYKCKRVKVTNTKDPGVVFDVYYTKEMGFENVNSLSPYAALKGMLMQYRLKKMGLEMQFTAHSIKKVDIPDNTFEVPAYFKIVSKEEMKKFFDGLQ